jgi:holdfast attachment protein HfaA
LLASGRVVLSWSAKLMLATLLRGKSALAAAALVASLGVAGLAHAQTANASSAANNAGYGRSPDQENQPVNPIVRDANGNLVSVDGVIEGGQDQSTFSNAGVTGVFDTAAGVGASGSATVFSGVLATVATSSVASATVSTNQSNSDNVSDGSSLSGGVNYGQ